MKDNFINPKYIEALIEESKYASDASISHSLDKAQNFQNLTHMEIAALLNTQNPDHISRIYKIAGMIKNKIYGNRIVMFAPLYVSDFCVNRCAYCSFNHKNNFKRHKLTMDELRQEVKVLESMGHKRLAIEAGEDDSKCSIDYILECIKTIYEMKFENGEIRRINVNISATTKENYSKLKKAGIGTYILFQETYHEPTYDHFHQAGPKKDFLWHLNAFDRAQEAGIDDVGGGVLFGLGNPFFDVMGLLLHNDHLEKNYQTGFHTISVPRLCQAGGMEISNFPNLTDDETFAKIVSVIRIAVPFTGMILSTRESHEMRKKLLPLGITQISAGSNTEVGGYAKTFLHPAEKQGAEQIISRQSNPQFLVNDERSATSIISDLMDDGLVPSFCTACYRGGRTGDRFMSLAKSGEIGNVCLPNALMTLCEYSMDYGDDEFKSKSAAIIENEIENIQNKSIQEKTIENIKKIRQGEGRDFFV